MTPIYSTTLFIKEKDWLMLYGHLENTPHWHPISMGQSQRLSTGPGLDTHLYELNPCAYLTLNPQILCKFERWKKKSQKFQPTFKIGSDTRRANEIKIESLLKQGSNPHGCVPLWGSLRITLSYLLCSTSSLKVFQKAWPKGHSHKHKPQVGNGLDSEPGALHLI